ncbi:unnamed protein product [Tuber aestivum]|uniref:Hydrophobin n=1 Tax=Tuber aestivum TaxID=59557 RepID=A0A292PQL2_9PEZI|nr:unnamed protein product [Tuber aestivum]
MKSSFITFISLFLFLIGTVVAAPSALDSTEIVKRQNFQEVDAILGTAKADIIQTNTAYNATSPVTTATVTSYCNDIIVIINIAITECGKIPPNHKFLNITLIANILFDILCEINFTLSLLLSKCGLLGGLLIVIIVLVSGLILALNTLLIVVAGVCVPGLLALLLALILSLLGPNCLILLCGLVL